MNGGFGLFVAAMATQAAGRPALDPLNGERRMGVSE